MGLKQKPFSDSEKKILEETKKRGDPIELEEFKKHLKKDREIRNKVLGKESAKKIEVIPDKKTAIVENKKRARAGKDVSLSGEEKEPIKNEKETEEIAKQILDKYATAILRDSAIHEKNGVSIPNLKRTEDYNSSKYNKDIVLWIPPKDCIRLEFEHDDYDVNLRCIRECECALKPFGLDYCITEHEGGKSPYVNVFNLKGIPVNEDNPLAKNLLVDLIASNVVKEGLDRSNLGWTYSPVIEHPHWKKKYKGAIHKVIRGKNPVEHENEYPKELLKRIKKSKIHYKYDIIQIQQKYSWVNAFLINFCTENKLPVGNRNRIIEKNLAVIIVHRKDRDKIMEKYLKTQGRKHNSLTGWFNKVINGDIRQVSPGELKKYIKDNNVSFKIPTTITTTEEPEKITITPEEHIILTNPDLLELIDKELDKTIVEEHETRKAILLNTCGKYVKNANIASFNLCVNSNSGAGKDYITKNVLKIFPSTDIEIRTRISPTALTYWHNSKFEPEWTWENKVLVLLDISNTILNCDVFKLMCSDEIYSTVTIEQRAYDIKIQGKPVIIITTASANPKSEMLRRFPFLQLDETVNQTKSIKKAQAKAAIEGVSLKYNPLITSALGKIGRVRVKIPFADRLIDVFPDEHIIMRTHFSRLLDYIKASAALYQFQREKDNEGFVIAQPPDYDNATILLQKTTSNPMMIPLSRKQQMLLAECRRLGTFTVKELEPHIPFLVQSKIYSSLDTLQEYGFLNSFIKETEESKRPVRYYSFVEFYIKNIPTWDEIENSCRKKGIKGIGEIEGIRGNEGINGKTKEKLLTQDMMNNDKNNSLNSPPISPLENKKNLHEKISEVKLYVNNIIMKGHDGVSYAALKDHFDEPFISKLIESQQLFKIPNTDCYKWEGK